MRNVEINFKTSSLVLVLQIVLIIAKVSGLLDIDWLLVFLPVIISFALFIAFFSIVMLIYIVAKLKE